jgi:hypothetical protein
MKTASLFVGVLATVPWLAMASEEKADLLPAPSAELLAPRRQTAELPSIHPAVVLRDLAGKPVAESGLPVDAKRTCDGCHDVAWIEAHDYHATATQKLGQGSAGMGCFLCHVRTADNRARLAAAKADASWADTATLAALGLAVQDGRDWRWRKDAFAADGSISAKELGLGRPADRACGFCHGVVDQGRQPLALSLDAGQRMTDLQGIVFSGQRISDSALNIAGKDSLTRPWDVHAERMVSCANCHFPPNHPAYAWSRQAPEHLQFDARRSAISEYVRRPDHRLARGRTAQAIASGELGATIRGCESCHEAGKAHAWLPRADRHFAALACGSCHIPAAYAPARQETDSTVLGAAHEPRVVYRGLRTDGFITGFRPALLPTGADGRKLAPNNLVTSWYWAESAQGGIRAVPQAVLERAFFANGAHRVELVRALDRNGDGKLTDDELVLDTAARHDAVRDLLVAAGASAPKIIGKIEAYPIFHGVTSGRFATRDCSACHTDDSRLTESFTLAATVPFGATIEWSQPGARLLRDGAGTLALLPEPPGLHVFGHTKSSMLDGVGILLFAGALAGAAGHGILRIRASRRRRRDKE